MYTIRRNVLINRAVFASVATLTAAAKNPSICQDQVWNVQGLKLPKFASITPSTLDSSVNKEITDFQMNLKVLNDAIGEVGQKHPNAVVNALEKIRMPVYKDWSLVGHLMSVNSSEDIREVHKSLQEKVVKATQGKQQPILFKIIAHSIDSCYQ